MSVALIAWDRGVESGRAQSAARAPEDDTLFPKLMQELERELVRNGAGRAARSEAAVHKDGQPATRGAPACPATVTDARRLRDPGAAAPMTDPCAWHGDAPSSAAPESRWAPTATAWVAAPSRANGLDGVNGLAAGPESVALSNTATRNSPAFVAPALPGAVGESDPALPDDGLSNARSGSAGPMEGQALKPSNLGPSTTLIGSGVPHGAPAVVAVAMPRLVAREADQLRARIARELSAAGLANYELIINGTTIESAVSKGGNDGH